MTLYDDYTTQYEKRLTKHSMTISEFYEDMFAFRFDYDWDVRIDDSDPNHIVAEVYLKLK